MASPYPILNFYEHPSSHSALDEMPPPTVKLQRTLSHVSDAEKETFKFMDA
jgi:hypothetical protein